MDPDTHRPIIPVATRRLNIPSPVSGTSFPAVGELSKELIVDQFVSNHDGSSAWQLPNSLGIYPSSHSGVLCFNQATWLLDINSELGCNTMKIELTTVPRSLVSNMNLPKPIVDFPSDNSLPQCTVIHDSPFWESVRSCNNDSQGDGKSTTTYLQESSSIIEGSAYKEIQRQLEGEPEDFKWSEYLNGAFPVSAALQNQSEPVYGF